MFPSRRFLALTRSRSTPVRCARLAIRDRVDHAATPQRVGYPIGPRRRVAPAAAAIAGGEQHQSSAPGTAVRGLIFSR